MFEKNTPFTPQMRNIYNFIFFYVAANIFMHKLLEMHAFELLESKE